MIVTFTLIRKRPHLSKDEFLSRWIEHTERFDLLDHPYITCNRLMLLQGEVPYVGLAENHWPDLASLEKTSTFYREAEAGQLHWADLESFMDIENSPTVVVTHEADVSTAGTRLMKYLE